MKELWVKYAYKRIHTPTKYQIRSIHTGTMNEFQSILTTLGSVLPPKDNPIWSLKAADIYKFYLATLDKKKDRLVPWIWDRLLDTLIPAMKGYEAQELWNLTKEFRIQPFTDEVTDRLERLFSANLVLIVQEFSPHNAAMIDDTRNDYMKIYRHYVVGSYIDPDASVEERERISRTAFIPPGITLWEFISTFQGLPKCVYQRWFKHSIENIVMAHDISRYRPGDNFNLFELIAEHDDDLKHTYDMLTNHHETNFLFTLGNLTRGYSKENIGFFIAKTIAHNGTFGNVVLRHILHGIFYESYLPHSHIIRILSDAVDSGQPRGLIVYLLRWIMKCADEGHVEAAKVDLRFTLSELYFLGRLDVFHFLVETPNSPLHYKTETGQRGNWSSNIAHETVSYIFQSHTDPDPEIVIRQLPGELGSAPVAYLSVFMNYRDVLIDDARHDAMMRRLLFYADDESRSTLSSLNKYNHERTWRDTKKWTPDYGPENDGVQASEDIKQCLSDMYDRRAQIEELFGPRTLIERSWDLVQRWW